MMQLGTPKRPARIRLGDLRIDQQVGVGDTANEEANETQNADPVQCDVGTTLKGWEIYLLGQTIHSTWMIMYDMESTKKVQESHFITSG